MNRQNDLFRITYMPLLIRLESCETAKLVTYLGSALHGIVGWALAEQSPEAYRFLFENRRFGGAKQDIVNPYIIEPPIPKSVYRQGEKLMFKLILLGDAVHYTGQVVEALAKTATFGIGAERKVFRLLDIFQDEQKLPVYEIGKSNSTALIMETLSAGILSPRVNWCSVHLTTPLRIRRSGELVQAIDFPTIIRNISRRLQSLVERYGGEVNIERAARIQELAEHVVCLSSGLRLIEMDRYSNRRSGKMDWNGMLGALTFEGELAPFVPWLDAASKLHIGRNTTFGCGKIDVVFDH